MEDSKKYFISLDNVDIDYLPSLKKYLQGSDCDKVPLWSVVNASKSFADEICEFELFSKDDKDTTASECDENNSTEQCYICDTQVPKAYMQAHCTGEKHRICAAIIRHALRRATQHAECVPFAPKGVTAQPVSLIHSESTYFCDHCALAVNVKNKGTHEKTKEHRVSVIHDRLLNGLLITYTDKERVVADSRYEAELCNESDDVNVEKDVSRDDDVTTAVPGELEDINHNNNETRLPAILETTFAADTSHAINSDKGKGSSDEEENDAESIDIIDNNVDQSDDNWVKLSSNSITDQADIIYQGDATTFNEHKDIEIVTVSSGIVRVPAKNFHGISYKLTGGISCLICQKTIVDIKAHIQEPVHIELLSVPVADRNCIRQISPLWHHCIICNKLEQSVPLHKSSSPHQSKLLSLELASKKQGLQKKLNGMFYCELCHCDLGKTGIEEHFNGKRHATNLSRTTFAADNRVLHYHFKRDEDKIECSICNIVVSDDETDAHIVSDGHKNNYMRFLVTNHISKLNKSFYCDCCKQKFRLKVTTEIEHVQNISHKIHKTKVSGHTPKVSIPVNVNCIENFEGLDVATIQLLYLLEKTSNTAKRVTCKVCKHTFKNKSTQIKNHMKKQYHQYNIHALLYVNKIKNNLDGTYFCEVCRSTIDHTKEIDHIDSMDHIINERHVNVSLSWRQTGDDMSRAAVTPSENPTSCVNVRGSDDREINVKNALLAYKSINDDKARVAMTPAENSSNKTGSCETTGNSKLQNYSKHDMNSYLSAVPSKPYEVMCQICNTVIPYTDANIKDHLNGRRHNSNYESYLDDKRKLQLKTVEEKLLCDNVKLLVPVAKTDKNDTQKTEALMKAQSIFLQYAEGVLYCRCCNTEVRYTQQDVDLHLSGWRHKVKSSAMLAENGLRVDKNKIYCGVCEVFLPNLDGITHIDSSRHKTKALAKDLHYVSSDKDVIAPAAESNETKDNCKVSNNNNETANREQKCVQDNLPKAKVEQEEGAKEVFCDVCEVYVINMSVHLNSNEHKFIVNHKENDDFWGAILSSREQKCVQDNLPKAKVEQKQGAKEVFCDVCEVYVINMSVHLNSNEHKFIVNHKENDDFWGAILSSREQKCVQDNLPKAKVEQKQGAKEVFCNVCKVYVVNMSVHLNSNQHQLTVNHKGNDDCTCKVCNLKVNKHDLKQHENGALHNENFKEILFKNQISQKWDGVLYCHICDLVFTSFSLIKHVENENHKRLMYRMVRL